MLRGWAALFIGLGAAIAYMAWRRAIKRRVRHHEQGIVNSPCDECCGAEVERTVSSTTPPPVNESKRVVSQLPVASEAEPTEPQRQNQDASEIPGVFVHEPASPQEPSPPATESGSVETTSTEISEVVHEVVSPFLDSASGGAQIAEAVLAKHPEENGQKTNEGSTTFPVEEAHSKADEALPLMSSEKLKTASSQSGQCDTPSPGRIAVGVEYEPLGDDEPELETTKDKPAVQPPPETAQREPAPTHPGTEPVTSWPPYEASTAQEPNGSGPVVPAGTYRDREDGEPGNATLKITKVGRTQMLFEAVIPVEARPVPDSLIAAAERLCNEAPEQTIPPPQTRSQKKRMQKPKPKLRRRITRKRLDLKQEEDKTDVARLLVEASEAPESAGSQRQRRPPHPSRYRPPSQEPLTVRQFSETRQAGSQDRKQSFDLTVRLLFQRSGHFNLGLLPQRSTDLPEEIFIGPEGNHKTVVAVHDCWYDDIYPENLASLLVKGIAWEGKFETEVLGYWKLSGRELYVLGKHDDLRGFTQTTRLKVGCSHVILCRNALLDQVSQVLQQIGCDSFKVLDKELGTLSGWSIIRNIVPTRIGHVKDGPEILKILQPEIALEIELKGGVYLKKGAWLQGFPPQICVSGEIQPGVKVFIDGKQATDNDDGSFVIKGYDTVGEHVVSIPSANTSKTYRITEGNQGWTPWEAHRLSRASLCGPLLRAADTSFILSAVVVPSSNSIILGPTPGDIVYCPRIQGPKQVGCVSFDAVWAVPYDPFGCRKATTTIQLLSAQRLIKTQQRHFTGKQASCVWAWCTAILNASRKGLNVDTIDPDGQILWKEYKAYARVLWRMLKK